MTDEALALRRYLLGESSEPEMERLETQLMTSEERFRELLIAEDELVDDFCAGNLDAGQEERYRRVFLATRDRREQHRFGHALRRHMAASVEGESEARVAESRAREPRIAKWRMGLAAAIALAMIGGVWLASRHDSTPVRLESFAPGADVPSVALFLPGASLRGPGTGAFPSIEVEPGIEVVELQLGLPADAPDELQVLLEGVSGAETLAEGRLLAQDFEGERVLVVLVPAELLRSGDYRVRVGGGGGELVEVATYRFRVRER